VDQVASSVNFKNHSEEITAIDSFGSTGFISKPPRKLQKRTEFLYVPGVSLVKTSGNYLFENTFCLISATYRNPVYHEKFSMRAIGAAGVNLSPDPRLSVRRLGVAASAAADVLALLE
jgi:hypothetical protein